ncbi:orotidine-5'-phosphate decarboxylase [Ochrovirga pacifica]|uniref:orotidine-5'-phosphate decarboxylase n=1 Tax=Ochrovirga pacifica TaxID=1042376 RepID=UPI0002557C10|nr:orotidine-5'-phosphate decarboxylase [Ochrovirga pacifica]
MNIQELVSEIKRKKSFLCVGLDVDLDKIPPYLLETEDPIFEFNKQIIDETHHFAVAYKPNTAFYEAYGIKGWQSLDKTIKYINQNYPRIFTIADAKRGDIGNTSTMYAKAFFEDLNFDSVTVAPYMGSDSVEPFLAFKDKFTILLALTSNKGGLDFQGKELKDGVKMYQEVLQTAMTWNNAQNLMFVVGATKASYFKDIRAIAPDNFLLVPGVGAQGGSLQDVCEHGINTQNIGLLINSSRGIIYASKEKDFAKAARQEAKKLQEQMAKILQVKNII